MKKSFILLKIKLFGGTMNTTIKSIQEFILKHSEESSFLFDHDKNSYYINYFIEALNFEHPACFDVIDYTQWLFFSPYGPIGFYTDKNKNSSVITVNEQGYFEIFCKHPQDIPLEIFRRKSEVWNQSYASIDLYIKDNDLYKIPEFLKTYEDWMRESGVLLDPDNLYYDKYGNIFQNYFVIDYDVENLILPSKEEQDFVI